MHIVMTKRGEMHEVDDAGAVRHVDRFPRVAVEVIHELVEDPYQRFTPAKVHNYLPILISREVRAQLHALQA